MLYDKYLCSFSGQFFLIPLHTSSVSSVILSSPPHRLKDLFEENEWKALKKTQVIQSLELEENFDVKFIKDCIKELINNGTLHEPFQNMIKFTKEKDR